LEYFDIGVVDSAEERSAGVYGQALSAGGVGGLAAMVAEPPWCIGHAGGGDTEVSLGIA